MRKPDRNKAMDMEASCRAPKDRADQKEIRDHKDHGVTLVRPDSTGSRDLLVLLGKP